MDKNEIEIGVDGELHIVDDCREFDDDALEQESEVTIYLIEPEIGFVGFNIMV